MNQCMIDKILVTRPTRKDIEALQVGDLAPDCFGRMNEITRISCKGEDINGKLFICYYTRFGAGDTSNISGSMKEGETVPTVPVTDRWNRIENVPVWDEGGSVEG